MNASCSSQAFMHSRSMQRTRVAADVRAPRNHAAGRVTHVAKAYPEALLFDCDGVLVDTEKDGHRVSFNEAFKQKGLKHEWSVELYGDLLEIGGGKERMTKYFKDVEDQEPFKSIKDEAARKELVKELHLLKTDLFMEIVQTGSMPLRPGVRRLINEAVQAGVTVAVCSTSNERAVSEIVKVMLGPEIAAKMRVFAGDMVPKKKPDPAIYLLAAKELGVNPERCAVIEDSHIGLNAAKSAGMTCFVTKSSYTGNEDFRGADGIFDCIGEVGEERFSLVDLSNSVSAVEVPNLEIELDQPEASSSSSQGLANAGAQARQDVDIEGKVPNLEIELDQPEASSSSSQGLANAGAQARQDVDIEGKVPNLEIELDQPEASSSSSQGLANAGAQARQDVPNLEIELDQPEASSSSSQGLANAGAQARQDVDIEGKVPNLEIELDQPEASSSSSQGLANAGAQARQDVDIEGRKR
eukprot:gene8216-1482_t